MLADIASDPSVSLAGISRFALYDHFTDHLIRRELKKPGRGRLYKDSDRRQFACALAWHLWTDRTIGALGCRLTDLPDEIFVPFQPPEEQLSSVKRDLLSGSFLDEKSGGVYFFPHRSFQEFLVAEYVWDHAAAGGSPEKRLIGEIGHTLTQEVFEFLMERDDRAFFKAFLKALARCEDQLPPKFFAVLITSGAIRAEASARNRYFFSARDAAVLIAHTLSSRPSDGPRHITALAKHIAERASEKPIVILCAVFLILTFGRYFGWEARQLAPALVVLLYCRAGDDLKQMSVDRGRSTRGDELRHIIFECCTAWFRTKSKLYMTIEVDELFRQSRDISKFPIVTVALEPTEGAKVEMLFTDFLSLVRPEYKMAVRAFYENDANVSKQ